MAETYDSTYTITCGGVPFTDHTGLIFETAMPGGYTVASFTLALQSSGPIDPVYHAFRHNAKVIITGPGIRVWEGLVKRIVPDKNNAQYVNIECVGIWGNSRNNLLRRAYLDHGYANWYDALPLPPGYAGSGYTYDAYKVKSEKFTVDKYSRLYVTFNKATFATSEGHCLWYFIDPDFTATRFKGTLAYNLGANQSLRLRYIRASTFSIADLLLVNGAASQAATAFDYAMPYTDVVAIGLQMVANASHTNGSEAGVYYGLITEPTVVFTSLTLPLTVKAVADDIVSNVGYQGAWIYDSTKISPSSAAIESLMFDQPVSLPEMFETLNAYVDFNMGVWDDRKFAFQAKPTTAEYTAVLSTDNILQDNLEWEYAELYNHVYVRYADENQHTVYMYVSNTDPDNYLNMWGSDRCGSIWLSDSQSDAEALAAANAFLDSKMYATPSGTVIMDARVYGYLRSGMLVKYLGGPYKTQFLTIMNTRVSVDAGTIELTLSDVPRANPRNVLLRRKVQRWKKIGLAE